MSNLADRLAEERIHPRSFNQGDQKIPCPQCSDKRRNKADPCLSLKIDERGAAWRCHHCAWSGGFTEGDRHDAPRKPRATVVAPSGPLPAEAMGWFASRGISAATLTKAGVCWSSERGAVMFPYRRPGSDDLANAKFRKLPKAGFSQITGGEKLYWLLDRADVAVSDTIVIVEGEMDALALIEAGVPNVISVPDGAPKEVKDDQADSKKFSFVATCDEWVQPFARIVLATDADGPGQALAEELARRYGKDRCWRVLWPDGCKDANDHLLMYGAESLVGHVADAKPYPVSGVYGVDDFASDVMALFWNGHDRGVSTGYDSLDQIYTVVPGQLTVVTGIPNHGKSEFIDQLMVNLAKRDGWIFGACSFENDPADHISKWAEKWLCLPFHQGPTVRMMSTNLEGVLPKLREHFHLIRSEGEEGPTLDWILGRARVLVKRHGINGLVIDPYNEIEHRRPSNQSETEYVSEMLSKLKRFAQSHAVHVWFVAHPAKLKTEGGKTPVPTLYDISGSANFANKTDCGLVVQRGQEPGTTDVYVRKCRSKWVGRQGVATLGYNRATGVYSDMGIVRTA